MSVIDLSAGMGHYRVIDNQADAHCESQQAIVHINSKPFQRRVVRATGYIALIQETDAVDRGFDGWHTEGPAHLAKAGLTLVQPYAGDRKCSCATYWNTGNPFNLAERHVLPIDVGRTLMRYADWSLWNWLAQRHERVSQEDRPPGGWFKANPDELLANVQAWLSAKNSLVPTTVWTPPSSSDHRYLYVVTDASGRFVKLGKCSMPSTSPPLRRLCQYQPGNPRRLEVGASWYSDDPAGLERLMQGVLRRSCEDRQRRKRAEWFELSLSEALDALREFADARGLVSAG